MPLFFDQIYYIILFRKVEWKGKWSDKSSEWTEELKKKLQLADSDDGTFWINITDFRKYYEGVQFQKYFRVKKFQRWGYANTMRIIFLTPFP